jgi:hypothetical protein
VVAPDYIVMVVAVVAVAPTMRDPELMEGGVLRVLVKMARQIPVVVAAEVTVELLGGMVVPDFASLVGGSSFIC